MAKKYWFLDLELKFDYKMAQRISKEEYEKQSSDYTKKALADLNDQLKNFRRKENTDEEVFEKYSDDENLSDDEYTPHKNKRRIIIETNMKSNKKRTKNNTETEFNFHLLSSQEKRIKDIQERLKAEEQKTHFLTLDLSNAKCDLENTKEKLETTGKNYSNIIKIRFFLMLYLIVLNIFISAIWVSLPLADKFIFTPFASASLYTGLLFKRFFYKFKKL